MNVKQPHICNITTLNPNIKIFSDNYCSLDFQLTTV